MEEVAVAVRDAYKNFSGTSVLRGFNMTVKKGSVYSLLGPSGCGKTTLLSCILGLEHLNSGSIMVSTTKPKEIGYMPQELGLHLEMTVEETISLYGVMFGLNKKEIEKKLAHLVELFELPPVHCLLSNISGGQKRRVSLAVSLMHDPQLLIFDEPTVGLDPILQHRVWEHFVSLSVKEGKTIIITTHYIEEARRSDRVGLMRGGVLLEEDHPQALMDRLSCTTMEETFLKLCSSKDLRDQTDDNLTSKMLRVSSVKSPINYDELFRFRRFKSQLFGNYLKVKRTPWIIVLILLLPSMQAYFFSVSFGRYSKDIIKMGVYSEEFTFKNSCASAPPFSSEDIKNCTILIPLSCTLQEALTKSLSIVEYSDLDTALKDTRTNHVWGVVHIKANFTSALIKRISLGTNTPNDAYDISTINVQMDRTNFIIRYYLEAAVLKAYQETAYEAVENCKISRKLATIPLKVKRLFYDDDFLNVNSGACSFISGFCFYFGMMFTASMLLDEKLNGVMARNMVAGMTYIEIVIALLVIQVVILWLQTWLMFLIMYYIYDYLMVGETFLAMCILFSQGMVGVIIAIVATSLLQKVLIISYLVIGVTLTLFFTTGSLWPAAGMAPLLKSVAWMSPTALAVDGYRAVAIKGLGLDHPDVYWGFTSNLVWMVACAAVNLVILRIKQMF